jgi:hypothetical protein
LGSRCPVAPQPACQIALAQTAVVNAAEQVYVLNSWCRHVYVVILQVRKLDWVVWMTSFLSTMFLGVEMGLAISIGLALLIVIYESAFPHTALLGRVGNTTIYRNVKQFPNSQVGPVSRQGSWSGLVPAQPATYIMTDHLLSVCLCLSRCCQPCRVDAPMYRSASF